MKKELSLLIAILWVVISNAQESTSTYNILKMPTSAHVMALGGENISVIEDSPTTGWSNPALYTCTSNNTFGLNFTTNTNNSKWMGAQYIKAFGERHTGAISANYLSYGSMLETDISGNTLGKFTPKDIVINIGYSYLFSEKWAGGAALKYVYSKYAEYSAMAIAVDLGLNYYDEEKDLSISTVVQNIGTQIKAFDDRTAHLPFGIQIGFTKGMNHAPIRFSLTMIDVTRWSSKYYYVPDKDKIKIGQKILNHFVLGVDILPTNYLYLSAGYNFRRAYELKAAGSGKGAGLTLGGGINIKRIKAGISYARYHKSTSSINFNIGYSL